MNVIKHALRLLAVVGLAYHSLAGVPAYAQEGEAIAEEGGFGIRSESGDFVLRIRGGAHFDQRFFLEDPNDERTDQFLLRRARPDIQATVFEDFDLRLHADLAGNEVELMDVYANVELDPAVQIRAGKMKAPIGLERLASSWSLMFVERALPSALIPNRDMGVMLHGNVDGIVQYALGVFNGGPDGGNTESDNIDSKDFSGRIFLTPFSGQDLGLLEGLGFGVGGSIGDQAGNVSNPNLVTYRTAGREAFFRYRANGTAGGTTIAAGRRTRISPQASWSWRNLSAIAEYVIVKPEVALGDETASLENTAWQVTGGIVLTGDPTSIGTVIPEREFDPGDGGWGAFELVARANGVKFDPLSFPTFADPSVSAASASAYGFGLNWYLNRFVRLMVNYERTDFEAAEGSTELPTEHLLVSRLQFIL